VDYFIVRKGNVHVPSLYNGHPTSPYWYQGGFNIRTFVAWAFGLAIVIHGLAGSFNPNYNVNSKHMYSLGMLLSFATGATIYYVLNLIWPVRIYPIDHMDAPKTREYMAKMDGFFEDDAIVGTNVTVHNEMTKDGSEKNVSKILV
jgi:NCS1 family nucleobase:cation symporter-1